MSVHALSSIYKKTIASDVLVPALPVVEKDFLTIREISEQSYPLNISEVVVYDESKGSYVQEPLKGDNVLLGKFTDPLLHRKVYFLMELNGYGRVRLYTDGTMVDDLYGIMMSSPLWK